MKKRILALSGSFVFTVTACAGAIGSIIDNTVEASALQAGYETIEGSPDYYIELPYLTNFVYLEIGHNEVRYSVGGFYVEYWRQELSLSSDNVNASSIPILQDGVQPSPLGQSYRLTPTGILTNNPPDTYDVETYLINNNTETLSTSTHYPCYIDCSFYFEDSSFVAEYMIYGLPINQDYFATDDDTFYLMADFALYFQGFNQVRLSGHGTDVWLYNGTSLDISDGAYGYSLATSYRFRNYNVAYNDGYNGGYAQGRRDGYIIGYNDGHEVDPENYSFYGLITSVIDVPVNAIISLLDFNVLGVNLSSFFFSILTVCVAIFIIRMILAGGGGAG